MIDSSMVQHFINTRITFDSFQMFLFSLRMIYIILATKQRHFIHANKAHTVKIVLTFPYGTVSHRLLKPASPCDKDHLFLLIFKLLHIYQLKTCNYLPRRATASFHVLTTETKFVLHPYNKTTLSRSSPLLFPTLTRTKLKFLYYRNILL